MLYFLKTSVCIHHPSSLFTLKNVCQIVCYNYLKSQTKYFNTDISAEESDEKKKKKKTIRIPEVKLIYPDESVTINILNDAKKIAKRQNLQLIKMPYIDSKDNRDVYKLFSMKDLASQQNYGQFDKKDDFKKFKSTKLFSVKCKTAKHDLQIKMNHINSLLQKRHKIKLLITYTPEYKQKAELQQFINTNIKGKLQVQKQKGSVTIIVFEPLLNRSTDIIETTIDNPLC